MPEGDRNLVGCVCSHYRANGIVCLCYSSVLYAVGLFVPQAAHCRLCYKDSSTNGDALHCVSAHNIIFGLRSGDNKNGGVILRGGVALTAELGTFCFSGVLFLTLMLFNLMSEGIRAWVCIAAFVVANLVNHFELIEKNDKFEEIKTGLHELEFIETRVIASKEKTYHNTEDGVHVLNLVEGTSAIIESPSNAFPPYTIHYVETVIIPAAVGQYSIRPQNSDEEIKVVKAYVRQ